MWQIDKSKGPTGRQRVTNKPDAGLLPRILWDRTGSEPIRSQRCYQCDWNSGSSFSVENSSRSDGSLGPPFHLVPALSCREGFWIVRTAELQSLNLIGLSCDEDLFMVSGIECFKFRVLVFPFLAVFPFSVWHPVGLPGSRNHGLPWYVAGHTASKSSWTSLVVHLVYSHCTFWSWCNFDSRSCNPCWSGCSGGELRQHLWSRYGKKTCVSPHHAAGQL